MQSELRNINTCIGFSNCIPPVANTIKMRKKMHGQFIAGFPLSFHRNPMEHSTKIKSNIVSIENPVYREYKYQAFSKMLIDRNLAIVPKNWQLNSSEKKLLG